MQYETVDLSINVLSKSEAAASALECKYRTQIDEGQ